MPSFSSQSGVFNLQRLKRRLAWRKEKKKKKLTSGNSWANLDEAGEEVVQRFTAFRHPWPVDVKKNVSAFLSIKIKIKVF